ncbi:MAG: hypothetical protein HC922_10815 [Leptolyngbyaceae cyanobacterium SM2_3_12]|nr:hypothetical protein [Leptolyngbyaceae cyanobacterium SM2_3_12]
MVWSSSLPCCLTPCAPSATCGPKPGIKPGIRIETILESESPEERQILRATADYIKDLGKIDTLVILGGEKPVSTAHRPQPGQVPTQKLPRPVSDNRVVAEVQDFWYTMQPLLEEPLAYAGAFFSDARRPLLTLLGLGVLVLMLKLGSALAATVDSVPLFAQLMELAGIWCVLRFGQKNLIRSSDRQQLGRTLSHWWADLVGPSQPQVSTPKLLPGKAPQPFGSTPQLAPAESTDPAPAEAESIPPTKLFAGVVGTVQVLIPLTGVVDIDALKAKLEKDLGKIEGEIKALSGRLSNAGFVDKAPAEVVQGARDSLAEAETQAAMLKSRLERL